MECGKRGIEGRPASLSLLRTHLTPRTSFYVPRTCNVFHVKLFFIGEKDKYQLRLELYLDNGVITYYA